jgi:oxaloacetate decarboxylase gamma subunit
MPITDLLLAGTELMLLGMAIVFSFLTVLVFTLRGMSWLASRIDRQPVVPAAAGTVSAAPSPRQDDEGELVAVISAAIARHRARHSR